MLIYVRSGQKERQTRLKIRARTGVLVSFAVTLIALSDLLLTEKLT